MGGVAVSAMTPELAEALAARLTVVCIACGESLAGHVDAQGRCSDCTADNIAPCAACGEVYPLDRFDMCGPCGHCSDCGESLEGATKCSEACERAAHEAYRADMQETDR